MHSRMSLLSFVLVTLVFALPLVAYAGVPFFGPIIPPENSRCAAGFGMLMDVVNRIISLLLTLAIVFVAPLMVAWAGFLFVVNPVNAGGKEQAKKILLHTVVGIVVALAGYMIVAALMAVLYSPQNVGKAWSELVGTSGAPVCIPIAGSLRPSVPPGVTPPPVEVVTAVTVNVGSGVVVSERAINILKEILRTAGLTSATITSGRRTSDDQTRIMYDNLQTYGIAHQKALYGPSGDAVIDVYAAQKQAGASEATIKAAMKQKVEQLGCVNVSNHCSTNDVFDVAPSSINNAGAFFTAVQNSPSVRRYIFPPADPAYHIEL